MLDLINLTYFGSQSSNAQQPTSQGRPDFQGGTGAANTARFAQEAPSVGLASSVANDVGQPGQLLLRTLQ